MSAEPAAGPPPPHPPRQVPVGLLVIGGSVLASFLWWLVASRPSDSPAPEPVPPAIVEPSPPAAPDAGTPPPSAATEPAAAPPREPAPAPARPPASAPLLRVSGDVDRADVFVDRSFVGKTPLEWRDITAGPHQINISAAGYDGVSQRVDVLAEGPTDVTFALKAVTLAAAVDVVHKHRLGSCEGRLSADPSGLAYSPTGGNDAFRTSLDGLEVFAVDYQDKTLRLKLKAGRSYNFTTRAANADPLFVFHRDVEKARAKLTGTTR